MGQLTASEHATAELRLENLRRGWRELQPSDAPSTGRGLLEGLHLKAADSLQLAAAWIYSASKPQNLIFISADAQLLEAARKGGIPGGSCLNRIYRPTIQIPASSATFVIAARSNNNVRPASTHRHVAPADFIISIVATPTTGTSNRIS